MSYRLTLRVSGARACFSRAEFKAERASYEVITPSAARGIFESVYWRPGLRWVIDRIHVLNPIRFQSLSRNEIGERVPVATVRHAMRTGALHTLPRAATEIRQRRANTIRTARSRTSGEYLSGACFVMRTLASQEVGPPTISARFNPSFQRSR
ncbi:CRISPR-associated protein Cas5 [Azospirillum doebereinerae]|uniref:CRISPR-associated protein Cas5 n=1 Tax=Azospirillum doebereinerae TaxID=92933 RepID=A0A433IZW4_9PROT|nr:CRISPR-associated protein Cas5 [Azospirillum doebereinerae]RUQ61397.1 CRISPR-associated protein Cas5 [Azospirillum doebereinerae]